MRLCVLFCVALALHASDRPLPEPDNAKDFVAQLDAWMPSLMEENMLPGAAVAIIQEGKPVLVKGYGLADATQKNPVTAQTVFNIGSISKNVAAWGVMRLVEQGKLELDAPVSKYLTRWQLPKTEFDNNGVTIRRLLSHTAGLSLHGYPGYLPEDKLPSVVTSLSGEGKGSGETQLVKTIMEPGTKFKYSGGGYTILQLVIEEVTGESFEAYMQKNVFKPLAMNHSSYLIPSHVSKRIATPHNRMGKPVPNRRFTAEAAASLNVSLEDMVRFAQASIPIAKGGNGGAGIISQGSLDAMQKGSDVEKAFGMGFMRFSRTGPMDAWGHGGDNHGWHAAVYTAPTTGNGILIFTNGDGGGAVRADLKCFWQAWQTGKADESCFKPRVSTAILRAYAKDGLKGAFAQFEAFRQNPDAGKDKLREGIFNGLGYELMNEGRLDEAVEAFKFNTQAFPEHGNPHDSLGEAYMNQGKLDLAIKSYKRSLELDPKNNNATQMIEKIRKKQTGK